MGGKIMDCGAGTLRFNVLFYHWVMLQESILPSAIGNIDQPHKVIVKIK